MKVIIQTLSFCLLVPLTRSLHGFGGACFEKKNETSCASVAACSWDKSISQCSCASLVPSDILFVIDTSDSLEKLEFLAEKNFIASITRFSVPKEVRIGVLNFTSHVDTAIPKAFNNSANNPRANITLISNMIEGITPPVAGATDITTALNKALTIFSEQSPPSNNRYKLLVLLTDGRHNNAAAKPNHPCVDNTMRSAFERARVRVLGIGVGFFIDNSSFSCLIRNPADYAEVVGQFGNPITRAKFDAVRKVVEEATCPDNFNLTITEVSPHTGTESVAFIEVYNHANVIVGVDSLKFSGFLQGNLSDLAGNLWRGNTFLVVFDLGDLQGDLPNCRWCNCLIGNETYPYEIWCANATYIACQSSSANTKAPALSIPISNRCSFNKQTSPTGWTVNVFDSGNGIADISLDSVKYTPSFPSVPLGFTFELANIESDNSVPANWRRSCGSPGAPNATCTESPTSAPSATPTRSPSNVPSGTPTTGAPTISPTYASLYLQTCEMEVPWDNSGVTFRWNADGLRSSIHPPPQSVRFRIQWKDATGETATRVVNYTLTQIRTFPSPIPDRTTPHASFSVFYFDRKPHQVINCTTFIRPRPLFAGPGIQSDAFFEWFPWGMGALFVLFIVVPWLIHRWWANAKMHEQADDDFSSNCC